MPTKTSTARACPSSPCSRLLAARFWARDAQRRRAQIFQSHLRCIFGIGPRRQSRGGAGRVANSWSVIFQKRRHQVRCPTSRPTLRRVFGLRGGRSRLERHRRHKLSAERRDGKGTGRTQANDMRQRRSIRRGDPWLAAPGLGAGFSLKNGLSGHRRRTERTAEF